MSPIRVVVADDHELVRYALCAMLDAEADIEVVGSAHDGSSAVAACTEKLPDVLVLDVHRPGRIGVEVCEKVRDACPGTAVLVLAGFDEGEDVYDMLAAGACGYLLTDTQPEHITNAVRAVADGQKVFDPAAAEQVVGGHPRAEAGLDEPLSLRESEVLGLMAQGLSNKEIGRALWIGETTVKTHVSHILRKLDVADRTQAVLAAVRMGLVELGR